MSDPLFSVRDQVVLVSGGSRGIGKAIAQGFVERGARVIVTVREIETLTAVAGELSGEVPVVPITCDVASSADIQRTVQEVVGRFGRPTIRR